MSAWACGARRGRLAPEDAAAIAEFAAELEDVAAERQAALRETEPQVRGIQRGEQACRD